jgi:hypothetical protein
LFAWWANVVLLLTLTVCLAFLAIALLWRVGSWQVGRAQSLNEDEGLRIGARAPQLAAHVGDTDWHLSFDGIFSFVVFGVRGCRPCEELLRVAVWHPATSQMRLVYVGDTEEVDIEPEISGRWEIYRFHNEDSAREMWRAWASPYFHVVDPRGMIAAKGIANHPAHLDRLLSLAPTGTKLPLFEPVLASEEGGKRG